MKNTSAKNVKTNTNKVYSNVEKEAIYLYSKMNVAENIVISDPTGEPTQYRAIFYKDPRKNITTYTNIQSPWLKISHYGIPKLDSEREVSTTFYPDDTKRKAVKIPINPEDKDAVRFADLLREFDVYVGATEFRKKYIDTIVPPSKRGKLLYSACVKTPDEYDGKVGLDYVNIKLHYKYDPEMTANNMELLTKVYELKDRNDKNPVLLNINTPTELTQYINWNSEIKFIFQVVKIWTVKNEYGITLRFSKIYVIPGKNSKKENVNIDFLPSDDEDNDYSENENSATRSDNKTQSNTKEKEKEREDSDNVSVSDNEQDQPPISDSESSENEVTPTKNKRKNTKDSSDSEDVQPSKNKRKNTKDTSDSEDVQPSKNKKSHHKKSKHDSDDEESEEIEVKPSKKNRSKKNKKADSDEESSEDKNKKKKHRH